MLNLPVFFSGTGHCNLEILRRIQAQKPLALGLTLIVLCDIVAAAQNGTSSARTGWESSPNGRGTVDIIWSCLITILACSWTILHLNIPLTDNGTARKLLAKAAMMLIAIIAPEYIAAMAFQDWVKASKSVPIFSQNIKKDWTMTHGYYGGMGGFAVEFEDGSRVAVSCQKLHWLIRRGYVSADDITITKEEIEDRGKADWFTKGFTLVQTGSFVLQCIARPTQHLPTTQLEIATCAFVACAFIIYWFWWNKPMDVETQTVVRRGLSLEVLNQFNQQFPPKGPRPSNEEDPDMSYWSSDYSVPTPGLVLCGLGVVFCSLHLIAWNDDFPTRRERILWRIFGLVGTGAAATGLLINLLSFYAKTHPTSTSIFGGKGRRATSQTYKAFEICAIAVGMLAYLAARCYLIFAMFYSLRSMPLKVYDTVDWSRYLPLFN